MENASKPCQNLDQIYENRRKSFKTRKIIKKESAKFQSTISNAPKRDQNLKNTQKSQRHSSNAPKTMHFSKNPVLEPRKIARNRGFSSKNLGFGSNFPQMCKLHERFRRGLDSATVRFRVS